MSENDNDDIWLKLACISAGLAFLMWVISNIVLAQRENKHVEAPAPQASSLIVTKPATKIITHSKVNETKEPVQKYIQVEKDGKIITYQKVSETPVENKEKKIESNKSHPVPYNPAIFHGSSYHPISHPSFHH